MESKHVPSDRKATLKAIYDQLNPTELKRRIDQKVVQLQLINQSKSWAHSVHPNEKTFDVIHGSHYPHMHSCPQRKKEAKKEMATAIS